MSGFTYTILLGPDGDDPYVIPHAINDSGVVVGQYLDAGFNSIGFIYNAGNYTVLNGPEANDTPVDAVGINSSGVVTGVYASGSTGYSFIYDNGTYTTLTGPDSGDMNVYVHGISDSGAVSGTYSNSGDQTFGFIYDSGTYTTLSGGPDGNDQNITPTAISASGVVAGYYQTQAGQYGVFTYSGGTFTALSMPTDAEGEVTPSGINNSGEIVGNYLNANGLVGFSYAAGTYTAIISPDSDYPTVLPNGIDNDGEIFGSLTTSGGGGGEGFINVDGTTTEIPGPGSGNTSGAVNAVNSSGTITGYYYDSSNNQHGFTAELCYLRGTKILTAAGMVAIEDVAIGDDVVGRFGGVQKIKWIGRQKFSRRAIREHHDRLPVCIHPGALGIDAPARKLFLSPGHSVLLGETLVLAGALVNGITVTQRYSEELPPMVEYFQIELETHDCILAEGVWAETYADAPGLRAQFHNEAEYYALYPDEPPPEDLVLCAPRPERGKNLEAALRPVAARAAAAITPGRFEGWVETISDWRITGWAIDHAYPELPVLLEVVLGDTVIGTVLACESRRDLAQAGIGNGRHGFTFIPNSRLHAAAWPELQLRRAGGRAKLKFSTACRDRIDRQKPAMLMAAE